MHTCPLCNLPLFRGGQKTRSAEMKNRCALSSGMGRTMHAYECMCAEGEGLREVVGVCI